MPGSREDRWGLWAPVRSARRCDLRESGATVLVFCLPAVLLWQGSRESALAFALDAAGWAVPVFATCGAFLLTAVAKGLEDAQAFLTVGVLTCAAWFFVGHGLGRPSAPPGGATCGRGKELAPYAVLIPALLAASSGQRCGPDRAASNGEGAGEAAPPEEGSGRA